MWGMVFADRRAKDAKTANFFPTTRGSGKTKKQKTKTENEKQQKQSKKTERRRNPSPYIHSKPYPGEGGAL
jgi:hypothetical protein